MADATELRAQRRAKAHAAARAGILDAARRVASGSARDLSLRHVAAEAGFAPAALYGYFTSKDELLLALAADDLTLLARAMRNATVQNPEQRKFASAAAAALRLLGESESLAAAPGALAGEAGASDAARLFNGRLIAALKVLSEAAGKPPSDRKAQRDVVLVAASLTGLALLVRSGRLEALGFSAQEMLERLDERFAR